MTNSYDKSYLKIALPAAFEGLFMILLASTDLIMVGTLGAFPIAAVSIFAQPRLVLLCFSRSLASSVTLLVSRKADEAGKEAASSIMKKSLTVCALLLGMLHILFFLFLEDILYLMGATPDYISLAMDYSVPALIATAAILRGDGFFAESSYVPDKDYFRQILPIFGSILSEQGSERAGMVIFSRMAAGLGPIPFAIHSVCMNICDIYWDFITGFGKASMVTAGRSCGRGSEEDWKAYKKSGMRLSFYMSCAVFVLTLIFRNEIFTIYSGDGIAPEAASIIMIFVAFVSFPEAYGVIGSSILRGSGRTAEVAAYSFFSVTLLRPIMTGLFLYGFGLGLTGVWMALVLDQMIRATCAIYFMRKLKARGWDRILADMA